MSDNAISLNIISFDIPYPPDYGGVIDVFYKLKALSELGVKIHLHTFMYGRKPSPELEKLCKTVSYYPRMRNPLHIFYKTPFIVSTRLSQLLLANLQKNDFPILFEGLHTCGWISNDTLNNRLKIVRNHNVEHDYYQFLAQATTHIFKKLFYQLESRKLKDFEHQLKFADCLLAISPSDEKYFKAKFDCVEYVPAFNNSLEISCKTGKGSFILYHGNLSVEENLKAVRFLLENVFINLEYPCKIVGKNPPKWLKTKVSGLYHVELIENPGNDELDRLISDAHIHILPTFQDTGIKLKLLKSISQGRHCVVNSLMVKETGLESLCHIAESASGMIKMIEYLWQIPFDESMKARRIQTWAHQYSDTNSANKILALLKKKINK